MELIATSICTLLVMFLLWGMVLSIGAGSTPARAAVFGIAMIGIAVFVIVANRTVEPRDIARSYTVVTQLMDARVPPAMVTAVRHASADSPELLGIYALDDEILEQDREDSDDRRLQVDAGQPL